MQDTRAAVGVRTKQHTRVQHSACTVHAEPLGGPDAGVSPGAWYWTRHTAGGYRRQRAPAVSLKL
jgi:hypothetical protein